MDKRFRKRNCQLLRFIPLLIIWIVYPLRSKVFNQKSGDSEGRPLQIVRSLSDAPVHVPDFIKPMKAFTGEKLPEGDWVCEIKFDGYRGTRLSSKDGEMCDCFAQ
jgi:hypothetical protein